MANSSLRMRAIFKSRACKCRQQAETGFSFHYFCIVFVAVTFTLVLTHSFTLQPRLTSDLGSSCLGASSARLQAYDTRPSILTVYFLISLG